MSFEEEVSESSNTRLLVRYQCNEETFFEKGQLVDRSIKSTASRATRMALMLAVAVLLIGTNILTYAITVRSPSKMRCRSVGEPPKVTSMLRDLELETFHYRFESTFFDQKSPFCQPPSPATDKAWEDAGANFSFLLISEEDMEASNLTLEHIHLWGGADQANLTGFPEDMLRYSTSYTV
ncbi:hypothetical protein F5Y16DRAFT_416882 [Xylariaceae sp. FL0255]|nr:hypothetical protein F5Y16DRAFT_416882 [Xylariaceae sp. FL0255]